MAPNYTFMSINVTAMVWITGTRLFCEGTPEREFNQLYRV